MEKKAFELLPLFTAAVIGAAALYFLEASKETDTTKTLATGAAVGALVQIGVRTLGVS